ncbi:hypothetical protein [Chromobacterium haemolyticum]|nr:hypothetical protein [Chromobacterium haemolyticum]
MQSITVAEQSILTKSTAQLSYAIAMTQQNASAHLLHRRTPLLSAAAAP